MTTTFTYDITHADATRTILTVVDRNGTVAEESRLPAPAAAAPPTPQAPIPPPIDLPVGAGWKASRRILTDAVGTKTTTTSYTIEKDSTRFIQTEGTIGQGETKVTKGAPTPIEPEPAAPVEPAPAEPSQPTAAEPTAPAEPTAEPASPASPENKAD